MMVLLVWEAVGESVSFYAIKDPTENDICILEEATDQRVGSTGDDSGARKISNFLSEKEEYCEEPGDRDNCKWADFKIEENGLSSAGSFDRVFVSGFMM